MYEPRTIDRAMKPIHLMNMITGMGVFVRSNGHRFKCLEFVYTGCYLLLFACMCWYGLEIFEEVFPWDEMNLNLVMLKVTFMMDNALILSLVVVVRLNAKKMRRVITMFDDYDRTVEKIGLPTDYRSVYRYQLYSLGISQLFILVYSTIMYLWYVFPTIATHKRIVLSFVINVPLVLINICVISFCFWIRCLRLKFQQLNDRLRGMRATTSDLLQQKKILTLFYDFENKRFSSFEDEDVRSSTRNTYTIRAVKQAHLELVKIAYATNTAFEMQLLLLMSSSFVFIVSLLLTIYRIMWLDLTTMRLICEITPSVFIVCFFGLNLLVMSRTCVKTNTEAAIAGDIICKLYKPSTSKRFRAEIREFILQLVQNPLTFSACGFFNVDHRFVPSIVRSMSTYLVILIQVEDLTNSSVHKYNSKNSTASRT